MEDLAKKFKNYTAFSCHFQPVTILKTGKDHYTAYYGGTEPENQIQHGSRGKIRGEEWEQEVGFGSEIWPCYAEYLDCEAKEVKDSESCTAQEKELAYIIGFAVESSFDNELAAYRNAFDSFDNFMCAELV